MNYDQFGQPSCSTDELCDILYADPTRDLSLFKVSDNVEKYNSAVSRYYMDLPPLTRYVPTAASVEEFDANCQQEWYMPDEYKRLDIAEWVLTQCSTQAELQRVGEELILYQERGLFNLLRYLKYFVDHLRDNGVIWGIGRGSSVASYVLYLIGVHRIDSLFFDLPIEEFLK